MPTLLTPESVLGSNEIFLIYGEPKTGKSEIALTAPGPIYINCIGPANEIKTRYSRHFIERDKGIHNQKKYYFDSVRETYGTHGQITDNPTAFDEACTNIDNMLEAVRKGDMEQPTTIITDNATVLEEYQMNKSMIAGYELAGAKEKTALHRMRQFGIIKPGDNDWGGAQSLMTQYMSFVFSLPFHIVMVAHEYKEFKASNGNSREREHVGTYPLFVGQQRTSIARAFDNVWRTSVEGSRYLTQVVGDDKIVAGTRVGGVLCDSRNKFVENMNLTVAIEKFKKYPKEMLAKMEGQLPSMNVRASLQEVKESSK